MTDTADMQMQTARHGALAGVLGAGGGTAGQRIERALRVLVEQFGLQVAYVSEFRDGLRVVTHSVSVPGGPILPVGTTHPVEDTVCHLVVSGDLPALVGDAGTHPVLAGHPHTAAFGIAAHAGVPLRVGGQVRGAVCCAGTARADTLNPRDEVTLRAVAAFIGEVLDGDDTSAGPDLRRLAQAVAAGHDLQALTRPLLQLLQEITGLESTLLTLVDPAGDEQVLAYTHNTGDLDISEGSTVSWQDSLCRRAVDEDRYYVTDVATVWPDARLADDLGIATYVSVPVRDANDQLLGTLCGVSTTSTVIDERELAVMATFAQLIAAQLARETAHSVAAAHTMVLEQRLGALRNIAERDTLTGLANRAGIHRWLAAAGARIAGDGGARLAVAFIDLDGFKAVNDTFGHATGDEVLRRFAASLAHTGRTGDLHGRLGGDEFIVAALLPLEAAVPEWTQRVRRAAVAQLDAARVVGSVGVVTCEPGTADFTVEEVLDRADQAMYAVKHATAPVP